MGETIFSVTFDMLNEESQKRIISNNPSEEMLLDATTSQYAAVREMAVRSGRLSNETLNKMFEKESDKTVSELILKYLVKSDITTRNISSPIVLVRKYIAEDSETSSEDLTKMLQNEENSDVIHAIMENPKFKKTPENMDILLNCEGDWEIRLFAAESDATTAESLISRLKSRYEDDEDVIPAIFDNLSKRGLSDIPFSKDFSSLWVRMEYARRTKNPKYLYEALMEELSNSDYMDSDVIEKICNNNKFDESPTNSKIYKIFAICSDNSIDYVCDFKALVDMLIEKEDIDKES